jgi:hypothetical protein
MQAHIQARQGALVKCKGRKSLATLAPKWIFVSKKALQNDMSKPELKSSRA